MKKLLKNPFVLGYSILYLITLLSMRLCTKFPVSEALTVLVIVGGVFSLAAYFISKSSHPLSETKPGQKHEALLLGLVLIYITALLTTGMDGIRLWLFSQSANNLKLKEVYTLSIKLILFVLIPFFTYKFFYHFTLRDFGLSIHRKDLFTRKNFFILLILASILLLFQYFLGNGARPIREGTLSARQIWIGIPLLYTWLFFEVGLVEEFFFRALVQSRLTALIGSETGGILLSGLVFGLAHAPGFYLRSGGTLDNLGSHPSLFLSLGYSILVLSVAGFFLSIVWSKTRNLWLIMAIHACTDLLPGLAGFVSLWGIQ